MRILVLIYKIDPAPLTTALLSSTPPLSHFASRPPRDPDPEIEVRG